MNRESSIPTPKQIEAGNALIRKYALYAMGCGLIPSPVVDMVAVTAIEVRMITELSDTYEFKFPRDLVLCKIALSLLGSVVPIYFARQLQNGVKFIPGFGFFVAAGMLAVVNGASVYAVGKVFQRHIESGGTFLSGNNTLIRRFFKESYDEGRQLLAARA